MSFHPTNNDKVTHDPALYEVRFAPGIYERMCASVGALEPEHYALLGGYLNYGFDPRTAKRFTDSDGIDTTDRVLEALMQAERSIAAIEQASLDIRNTEFNQRLRRIAKLARDILTLLEEDPRDLRRARKFLNVYLDGARQVSEGYAKTHGRVAAPELEDNFRRVLATIEDVFQEQQQKLLESDVSDLDVQIEVLATQLKREGVI